MGESEESAKNPKKDSERVYKETKEAEQEAEGTVVGREPQDEEGGPDSQTQPADSVFNSVSGAVDSVKEGIKDAATEVGEAGKHFANVASDTPTQVVDTEKDTFGDSWEKETTRFTPAGAEGKHVITAPEFIAKWTHVNKGDEMPVCRLMARRSTAEKLSSSEIQGESQSGTSRNVAFSFTETQVTQTKKEGDYEGAYKWENKFTVSTESTSPKEFVNVVYDNFLIDQIQFTKKDKTQIVQSFDDSFLYSFGQAPEQARFSGVLINTTNHNWRTGWVKHYDQLLSAHNSLKNYVNTYLTFENMIWKGRILNTNIIEKSMNPVAVRFNFNFYIEEDLTPLGEAEYGNDSNEPPFPYTKPLRSLKQGEIPQDEQFEQSSVDIPPKRPTKADNDSGSDTGEDKKECSSRVQDQLKDGKDCEAISEDIASAIDIPKCESWKDQDSGQIADEIEKWIKKPIVNARSAVNSFINGDASVNKDDVRHLIEEAFKEYFDLRKEGMQKLVDGIKGGDVDQEKVEEELNALYEDAAVIRWNNSKKQASKVISGADIFDQFYQGLFNTEEAPTAEPGFFGEMANMLGLSNNEDVVPDQYVNNRFESEKQQISEETSFTLVRMLSHIINQDIGDKEMATVSPKETFSEFTESIQTGVKKWNNKTIPWNDLLNKSEVSKKQAQGAQSPENPGVIKEDLGRLIESLKKQDHVSGETIWPERDDITKNSFIEDLKKYKELFEKYDNKEKIEKEYQEKAPSQIKKRMEYFDTESNPNGNSYFKEMMKAVDNNMVGKITGSLKGEASVLGFMVYYAFITRNPELGAHDELSKKQGQFMLPSKTFLRKGRSSNQNFAFLGPLGKIKRDADTSAASPGNADPINLPAQGKAYKGSHKPSASWAFGHFNLGESKPKTFEPYGAGKVQIAYAQANDEFTPADIAEPGSDFWNPDKGRGVFSEYPRVLRHLVSSYAYRPTSKATETYQTVVDKVLKARKRYKKIQKCLENNSLDPSRAPTSNGRLDPELLKQELTTR